VRESHPMKNVQAPEGHPISIERAKELMAGNLADVYRDILSTSCAPVYWFERDRTDLGILNNGTVTFLQTPDRLLGVTAAHVLLGYRNDASRTEVVLQIMDHVVDDIQDRIIDVSDRFDLATFEVNEQFLAQVDKRIVPLRNWPPRPPEEGRGIMLAGYPAVERHAAANRVDFGLFTALVVARRVTDIQITWLIEREAQLAGARVPAPPPNYGLGGVSGGPLITWLESDTHIATYALGGIITEHPDYEKNEFWVERVVAVRADLISPTGRISG
jgi:hypothetical protein